MSDTQPKLLALTRFDGRTKTLEELREFGEKLQAEFLGAHGGKFPENGDSCRCEYCQVVFAGFIKRMDAKK